MNPLKRLRDIIFQDTPVKSVVVGGKYRLIRSGEEGNPFAGPEVIARVKDVKDGWVLYEIVPGGIFTNESMEEEVFLNIYKPIEFPDSE